MHFSYFLAALFLATALWTGPVARGQDRALGSAFAPLPVEDIPAKIEELKKMTQDERYKFITSLEKKYGTMKNAEILKNLSNFASAAKKMAEELGLTEENDYDLKEILALLDSSLFQLSCLPPIVGEQLLQYYKRIYYSQDRFKVLEYWARRIESQESIAALTELMDFAARAREYSLNIETGDEREYIPKRANDILRDASARLLILDPIFEGVYSIEFSCRIASDCMHLPKSARLLVINTHTEAKVSVIFLDSLEQGIHYYEFVETIVQRGGRGLHGAKALRPEKAGEFEVSFDPERNSLSGWIRDSRSAGFILVSGRQNWSPAVFFRDGVSVKKLEPEQVTGVYHGEITGNSGYSFPGTLVVKRITTPKVSYIAGFQSFSREEFKTGEFFEKRGVLTLVSVAPKSQYIRWTLAYRPDSSGNWAWTGKGFSSRSGALFSLSFSKVGEITDPPRGPDENGAR